MTLREFTFCFAGLSGGLLLGASIGLLAAPQSGRRTRRALLRKGEEIQDRVAESGEAAFDEGLEMLERGKRYVSEKARETKEAAGALVA